MARNPAICHPFPFPSRVPWGNKMALTMTHFMITSARDPSAIRHPESCPPRWFKTHGSFPERRGTLLELDGTRRNERLERGRLTWRKKSFLLVSVSVSHDSGGIKARTTFDGGKVSLVFDGGGRRKWLTAANYQRRRKSGA